MNKMTFDKTEYESEKRNVGGYFLSNKNSNARWIRNEVLVR